MNSGNMLRSPRMSINFWQLSAPSVPVMAWSSTLIALNRDNFFSLKQTRKETRHKHNFVQQHCADQPRTVQNLSMGCCTRWRLKLFQGYWACCKFGTVLLRTATDMLLIWRVFADQKDAIAGHRWVHYNSHRIRHVFLFGFKSNGRLLRMNKITWAWDSSTAALPLSRSVLCLEKTWGRSRENWTDSPWTRLLLRCEGRVACRSEKETAPEKYARRPQSYKQVIAVETNGFLQPIAGAKCLFHPFHREFVGCLQWKKSSSTGVETINQSERYSTQKQLTNLYTKTKLCFFHKASQAICRSFAFYDQNAIGKNNVRLPSLFCNNIAVISELYSLLASNGIFAWNPPTKISDFKIAGLSQDFRTLARKLRTIPNMFRNCLWSFRTFILFNSQAKIPCCTASWATSLRSSVMFSMIPESTAVPFLRPHSCLPRVQTKCPHTGNERSPRVLWTASASSFTVSSSLSMFCISSAMTCPSSCKKTPSFVPSLAWYRDSTRALTEEEHQALTIRSSKLNLRHFENIPVPKLYFTKFNSLPGENYSWVLG